ncbi:tetratricopeptide repeat protein [Nonomuraea sp. NPDC050404]|uniref:tetratricopeptide repeat protein n=1 Tax=Nonomuraea sp. NPDC050404 TaxID=3155783 RepID=UPI0033C51E21
MKVADPIERARTLLQLRRPDDAERELRGLLAQEPENISGHALLGLALIQQGQVGDALEEAAEAVRLGPDQWSAHYLAAHVYYRAGRGEEGLTAARTALDLQPEHAPNWEVLARVHMLRGEWALMVEAALSGLRIEPEDCDLVCLASLAYSNLGDERQAFAAAAHAVRIDPESALAHFVLGRAALRFGDPRRAAESFREVLRLDPGFGKARDLLVTALKQRNPLFRRLSGLRGRFPNGWRLIFLLPVAPPIIAIFIIVAVLHWLAWVTEAWTVLRLARAKATSLLFEGVEARVSAVCLGLVAAGAALLGLGIGLGLDAIGTAGVAVMTLVTPAQEAAHTGSPRLRAFLYGWAGLLALAIAVSMALAIPWISLITIYICLFTVWLASRLRGRPPQTV